MKIEPDSNGVVCSVELRTVDSLNNQKLLPRPIIKTVLLVENEMVRFPTEKTNKGQDDMISWREPYVEALRKRLSVKIKLWNGETVYVAFCKFSTSGCDLFNYIVINLVTYTVCMCLNRLCTQYVCEKYKRSIYHCNYWLITKDKLWLNGNYNLRLIISLNFFIYRLSYSTLFMSTTMCSSAFCRYEPLLIVAGTLSDILLFLGITCTG